ncbi:MAG: helix-turn-helix domain-containing protein [Actinomycetota bacterium]
MVLVVLGVVEQRHAAVLEVLRDGVAVTEVARRYEVTRQSVHRWLRQYAAEGLSGLADRSSKPLSCPHQVDPEVEARIVELRQANEAWGPISIGHQLGVEGVDPVPGRSSIHRCLVRHSLIIPGRRRRKRSDYVRWERDRPMALWQMDIVGGVVLPEWPRESVSFTYDDSNEYPELLLTFADDSGAVIYAEGAGGLDLFAPYAGA